jgi:hypothetical protein
VADWRADLDILARVLDCRKMEVIAVAAWEGEERRFTGSRCDGFCYLIGFGTFEKIW